MGFVQKNTFVQPAFDGQQAVNYPAEVHFRVIAEPELLELEVLETVVGRYRVTRPLERSNASSGGRYQAYGVSIEVQSGEELRVLDVELKAVKGVRMVI
ncbi:MAG: DUF493 family protein [Kiritimatiellae bacterium]|nr:DUF493 family protein [Kiritimatiellia bacterium]